MTGLRTFLPDPDAAIFTFPVLNVVAESQRTIGGTPDRRGIPAATICRAKYRSLTFGKADG